MHTNTTFAVFIFPAAENDVQLSAGGPNENDFVQSPSGTRWS